MWIPWIRNTGHLPISVPCSWFRCLTGSGSRTLPGACARSKGYDDADAYVSDPDPYLWLTEKHVDPDPEHWSFTYSSSMFLIQVSNRFRITPTTLPGACAGSKGYDDADVSDAEQVLLQLGAAQQPQPVHNHGHHSGAEEKGGRPSVREIHLPDDDTANSCKLCCGSGWIRIILVTWIRTGSASSKIPDPHRVRISARHTRGGPPQSESNEDNKSGTLRVPYVKKSKEIKSGSVPPNL